MRAQPMQWHLRSWQNANQLQQPNYPDQQKLETILTRLAKLPPLVTPEEVDQLKHQLAEAAAGKRFILQAGDCAESFAHCSATSIVKQIKILQQILTNIGQSLGLMDQLQSDAIPKELYTSHESLLLHYEQALTRQYQDNWYNLSAHFPWIGMRSAQTNSAQVEYLRGIDNPIAIKVGPDIKTSDLLELIATLNPEQELGKITLITRFGAEHTQRCLPKLIKAIQKSKQPVLWCSDPMHGNSRMTKGRHKTRDLANIHKELCLAFDIHQQHQSTLGAVHLEASGDDVTECCGGLGNINEEMLSDNYQSLLDPRLNRLQCLETVLLIIKTFTERSKHRSNLHLINH